MKNEILKRIEGYLNSTPPFKIKIDIFHQESNHIAINFYMSLDQSDELINCVENSGEVSLEFLDAISTAIRTKKLELQKDMPAKYDMFKHWDNYNPTL